MSDQTAPPSHVTNRISRPTTRSSTPTKLPSRSNSRKARSASRSTSPGKQWWLTSPDELEELKGHQKQRQSQVYQPDLAEALLDALGDDEMVQAVAQDARRHSGMQHEKRGTQSRKPWASSLSQSSQGPAISASPKLNGSKYLPTVPSPNSTTSNSRLIRRSRSLTAEVEQQQNLKQTKAEGEGSNDPPPLTSMPHASTTNNKNDNDNSNNTSKNSPKSPRGKKHSPKVVKRQKSAAPPTTSSSNSRTASSDKWEPHRGMRRATSMSTEAGRPRRTSTAPTATSTQRTTDTTDTQQVEAIIQQEQHARQVFTKEWGVGNADAFVQELHLHKLWDPSKLQVKSRRRKLSKKKSSKTAPALSWSELEAQMQASALQKAQDLRSMPKLQQAAFTLILSQLLTRDEREQLYEVYRQMDAADDPDTTIDHSKKSSTGDQHTRLCSPRTPTKGRNATTDMDDSERSMNEGDCEHRSMMDDSSIRRKVSRRETHASYAKIFGGNSGASPNKVASKKADTTIVMDYSEFMVGAAIASYHHDRDMNNKPQSMDSTEEAQKRRMENLSGDSLRQAFAAFDNEGKGYITKDNLIQLCQHQDATTRRIVHAVLSRPESAADLAAAAANQHHNNNLSFADFVELFFAEGVLLSSSTVARNRKKIKKKGTKKDGKKDKKKKKDRKKRDKKSKKSTKKKVNDTSDDVSIDESVGSDSESVIDDISIDDSDSTSSEESSSGEVDPTDAAFDWKSHTKTRKSLQVKAIMAKKRIDKEDDEDLTEPPQEGSQSGFSSPAPSSPSVAQRNGTDLPMLDVGSVAGSDIKNSPLTARRKSMAKINIAKLSLLDTAHPDSPDVKSSPLTARRKSIAKINLAKQSMSDSTKPKPPSKTSLKLARKGSRRGSIFDDMTILDMSSPTAAPKAKASPVNITPLPPPPLEDSTPSKPEPLECANAAPTPTNASVRRASSTPNTLAKKVKTMKAVTRKKSLPASKQWPPVAPSETATAPSPSPPHPKSPTLPSNGPRGNVLSRYQPQKSKPKAPPPIDPVDKANAENERVLAVRKANQPPAGAVGPKLSKAFMWDLKTNLGGKKLKRVPKKKRGGQKKFVDPDQPYMHELREVQAEVLPVWRKETYSYWI